MRIFTFLSNDPDCPANAKAIARIQMPMPQKGGGTKLDWSPVFLHAPSEEEARVKAQTWYDAETEKYKKREEHYGKLVKARKTKAEIEPKIQKMSAEEFARLRAEAEARAAQPKPPSAPPAFGSKKDIPKIREMTEEEANEHAIRGPVPSLKPLSPTPPKAPALKPPAPKLVPPKKS